MPALVRSKNLEEKSGWLLEKINHKVANAQPWPMSTQLPNSKVQVFLLCQAKDDSGEAKMFIKLNQLSSHSNVLMTVFKCEWLIDRSQPLFYFVPQNQAGSNKWFHKGKQIIYIFYRTTKRRCSFEKAGSRVLLSCQRANNKKPSTMKWPALNKKKHSTLKLQSVIVLQFQVWQSEQERWVFLQKRFSVTFQEMKWRFLAKRLSQEEKQPH